MARFYGTYRYSADTKGRMNVPAPYRKAIADEPDGKTFWVTIGLERCLKVYAQSDWDKLESVFRRDPRSSMKRAVLWLAKSSATRAPSHSTSRGGSCSTRNSASTPNIKKDVVIVGLRDHFEIWAAEEREHARKAAPPDEQGRAEHTEDDPRERSETGGRMSRHPEHVSGDAERSESVFRSDAGRYVCGRHAGHGRTFDKNPARDSRVSVALSESIAIRIFSRSRANACRTSPSNSFFVHGNFQDIKNLLPLRRTEKDVAGILADLGISTLQLDTPERGFAFQSDAPIDMRMDRSRRRRAHITSSTNIPRTSYRKSCASGVR